MTLTLSSPNLLLQTMDSKHTGSSVSVSEFSKWKRMFQDTVNDN